MKAMFATLISLTLIASAATTPAARLCTASPVGGPPTLAVAGKTEGPINAAEWRGVERVALFGCMPDARIARLTLCVRGCTDGDKPLVGDGPQLTDAMRKAVTSLPKGTAFTITAQVVDGAGKPVKVPAARYTWQG